MLKDFRDFAMRGNVVDLAIGVVIGAAFGRIVESLVKDIIMPIVGIAGSADFSNYFLPLSRSITATTLAEAQKQGPVLAWGSFATILVNFMIVAFALFMVVRALNRLQAATIAKNKAAAEAKAAEPTPTDALLIEIRDLLARKA